MFNRILKFNKSTEMKKSHLATLLFASLLPLACSDYVGDYENEWKDPYGNEEAFKEMLNKFDWPWSPTCNTDDWIWCTVQKGEFMSQTEDGESWSQFTEGSVSLSFAGKDDKAYNFTTDLLPDDPTPILRRNGGLAVKLDKASGDFEAGVQVKSGDIANHSKLVVAYGNEYSEAYVSLRSVNKEGKVEGEWRRKLNVGSFEVLTVKYEDMEYVSGEKNIYSFIKNDANTIAFVVNKKASVDKGLTIVAIGFDGSALTEPKSSAKSTTAKSSSSVKSTTAKSSSSVKSTTAKSSSSVKNTAKSSSSVKSSSSAKTTATSSSSVKSSSSVVTQFIWNGKDKSNVIQTGFGSGSPWEALLDTVKNGTTSMFTPKEGIYEACNGLCGFIKFGPQNAWAQESFKMQPSQEKNIGVDVSAMKGLCVTYSSNKDAALYLDAKDKNSPTIGAAKVTLPKVGDTDKYYVKNFEWSDFEEGSWQLSGEEAAKSLSSIAIIFESSAEGSQFFNIYQIGSYGMCGNDNDISPSDIDASYFYDIAFEYAWDYMNPSIDYGEFVDSRDKRIYRTVKIGNQTWMAQNLDLVVDNSYCYNDTGTYCNKYGSLYTWAAAMDSVGKYTNTSKGCGNGKSCETFETVVGVCPTGWHMPSLAEWDTLISYAGDKSSAADLLKTKIGWKNGSGGSDNYGFSALPSGYTTSDLAFGDAGESAAFWSTDEADNDVGKAMTLDFDKEPHLNNHFYKNYAISIRCVKTEPIPTMISDEDLVWYGGNRLVNDSATTNLKKNLLKENVWLNADKYITFGASTYSPQLLASCKGGICGKTGKIPEDAYPGFGFMVNTDSSFENWGGVCVTYTASKDSIMMYLGTGGGADSAYSHSIKWNFYHIYLPAADNPNTMCFPLSLFEQSEWGPKAKFDVYMPHVREVGFQLKSNVSNSTFNIIAVGTYKDGKAAYDAFMQDETNRTHASDFLNPDIEYGEFTDTRDGQVYKTTKIELQTWMAQNLNYETSESACYGDKNSNCDIYGRLYTWKEAQSVCPEGWRLPRTKDYHDLFNETYNGANDAKMYKSKKGWTSTYNGTDDFGFTALPAGYRDSSKKYKYVSELIEFQTSTEDDLNGPCIAKIGWNEKPYGGLCSKSNAAELRSVRCIKDYKVADYLNPNVTYGELTDERDNQVYKTVEIGDQTWMAQNLNYKYQNGASSYCYDNDSLMCNFLGRLYLWSAAKEACPENWRLPTKADFEELLKYVGNEEGDEKTAERLKTTDGWNKNNNGTNDYGFSVLPAGYIFPTDRQMVGAGRFTDFWSISEKNEDNAYMLAMDISSGTKIIAQTKQYGFSVRCIQGLPPTKKPTDFLNSNKTYDEFTDSRDNQVYKTIKIGTQEWMAQNLNVKTKSSACYDDKDYNCVTYGRLYTWDDAQTVCPEGWHLPKSQEYQTLAEAVGEETAGQKLKAADDWVEDFNTGDNEFGFTVLPGGYKRADGYKWMNFGAFFQTSSADDVNGPCYAKIFENGDFESGLCSKSDEMRSVRCVKDLLTGILTDDRDGQTYNTIKIGNQTWMAENLNYAYLGSSKNLDDSPNLDSTSFCYENDPTNCDTYGRLYLWSAAMDSAGIISGTPNHCGYGKQCTPSWPVRGVCPDGWHLPEKTEWEELIKATGGLTSSKALRSRSGWKNNQNGLDTYGFSVLPAGVMNGVLDRFEVLGEFTTFWSANEFDLDNVGAYILPFNYDDGAGYWDEMSNKVSLGTNNKKNGYSVRCIMN